MRYGEHERYTLTDMTMYAERESRMTDLPTAMRRVISAERILTYISVALAGVAAAFLLFSLLSQREACYGMEAGHLLCQPVDALAAARAALVLMFPGVLFVGATIGALWQIRAHTPDARNAAFGLLVTSDILLIGIVVPALAGAGYFLAPATLLMTIVAILGTVKFVQDWRAGATQAS